MRILITGATGFIGRELLPMILCNFPNAEILCIARDPKKVLSVWGGDNRLYVCCGIDEYVIEDFDPEYVIHLAACNTSNDDQTDIDALIESNIHFGVSLLGALRRSTALKMFINTGSFSQYTPAGDAYLYSASKSAFASFLKYYCRTYNWKYITVVPYSVYGGAKTVKRIIDYIVEAADAPLPIDMTPGEQQLDFIHVDDVANFYISAIREHDSINNGSTFHIGTGRTHTIRELAEVIQGILHKKCNINWGGRKYRQTDIMYACAPRQADRDLIWRPAYDLTSGLKRYLEQ